MTSPIKAHRPEPPEGGSGAAFPSGRLRNDFPPGDEIGLPAPLPCNSDTGIYTARQRQTARLPLAFSFTQ
ncbi:hypothetical protein K32_14340 [Kaistia sp. 32K]|nr:hypothetical protein K32_14340 [Kaistia sp. 32K]